MARYPLVHSAILVAGCLMLSACGTSTQDRMTTGAAIGGAVGLVGGAVLGEPLGGAALGAATGAITGAATSRAQIDFGNKPLWE